MMQHLLRKNLVLFFIFISISKDCSVLYKLFYIPDIKVSYKDSINMIFIELYFL